MSAGINNQDERRAGGQVRQDADERKLRGLAIAFGAESVNLGGFVEYVAPEAVDRTLREALDVRALVDHDTAKVIGRTRAGTLSIRKTRAGLEVVIDPPNTSYAQDIIESVGRGDVSGMSFGFRTLADEWDFSGDTPVRTITDMIISEVSVVTFPAYPDTSVAVRSLTAARVHGRSVTWLTKHHRTRLAR